MTALSLSSWTVLSCTHPKRGDRYFHRHAAECSQSARRAHEDYRQKVPLPSPLSFPTTMIVSHTYRACIFLFFVRHFMENKHTHTHRKCAATVPKGNPALQIAARLANYLEIIGLDRGYMTRWCSSKKNKFNQVHKYHVRCYKINIQIPFALIRQQYFLVTGGGAHGEPI